MANEKFSTPLGIFGNQSDRWCNCGYKEDKTVEDLFDAASKVESLDGVELFGTWHINEDNVDKVRGLLEKHNFKVSTVIVDLFVNPVFGNGAIASMDPEVRQKAVEDIKKNMDMAVQLNCDLLDIWPGQDGYDYPFQVNYTKVWDLMIDSMAECADHNKDVRLALEYKIREPRNRLYIATVGKALAFIEKLGRENVGVTVDVGHGFFAYENVAETIALCKFYGDRLFHMHFNDNYAFADDDLIVGATHMQDYLEIIYWLKKTGYNGWYSLDQFPYRDDGIGSCRESIAMLNAMIEAAESVHEKDIESVITEGDATRSIALIRKILFKK
jgi:xylose isomerase